MKTLIALIVSVLMSVTVFAGMTEMEKAYASRDYTALISEAKTIIADADASVENKAAAQNYIGQSYINQKEYAKAIIECQKTIDNYPKVKAQCIIALCLVGVCYENMDKPVEAQEIFVEICKMQKAPLNITASAFSHLDKVALGKEAYLELIDTMLLGIPSTDENSHFLGVLKSEQVKFE